ncbi:hypothetical protein [Streptomyces olivaceoviridis]|uniref:hypothetical protein n=1 Tax=Streptomyces olivaceoviridis TaxID=1921 RepID=UPI0036BAE748
MHRIVIDQTKVRIDEQLIRRGATPFPRPLEWWQRTLPIWVTASEGIDGTVILEPNGKVANGRQRKLTPTVLRQEMKAIRSYLASRTHLDFSDALIEA